MKNKTKEYETKSPEDSVTAKGNHKVHWKQKFNCDWKKTTKTGQYIVKIEMFWHCPQKQKIRNQRHQQTSLILWREKNQGW